MSWDVTKFRVVGVRVSAFGKGHPGLDLAQELTRKVQNPNRGVLRFSGSLIRAGLSLALLLMAPGYPASAQSQGTELFGRIIEDIQFIQDDTGAPLARAPYDRCLELKRGVSRLTRTDVKAAIQALYDTGSFSEISASARASGERRGARIPPAPRTHTLIAFSSSATSTWEVVPRSKPSRSRWANVSPSQNWKSPGSRSCGSCARRASIRRR